MELLAPANSASPTVNVRRQPLDAIQLLVLANNAKATSIVRVILLIVLMVVVSDAGPTLIVLALASFQRVIWRLAGVPL
jgi:hypothetical protein